MLVNFRGPAHTFPYFSASDVIAHRVAAGALAGKIVLVGASAFGLGDRLSTPVGADFPGVEVHANAIDTILSGDFIHTSKTPVLPGWLAALIMCLAITAAVAWLPVSSACASMAGVIFGYLIIAQYLLVADGLVLAVVFPIVATFITHAALTSYRLYLTEQRLLATDGQN